MPETIANFAYAWMSALIVVGLAAIVWLLNKAFDFLKATFNEITETLKGILKALSDEKDERMSLRSDFESHKAACEARRSVDPHLHHRITDHITP